MCNMQMHPRRTVRIENGDFYLEQGKYRFPFSPPAYEPKTESSSVMGTAMSSSPA